MRVVYEALTGDQLNQFIEPMLPGVDAPKVTRYPLARDVVRYAGEWVVAVVAESRALAEDASELIDIEYEETEHLIDGEMALDAAAPLVHPAHGSNVLYRRKFVWGEVDKHFAAADEHQLSYRGALGTQLDSADRDFCGHVRVERRHQILDVWASIQMPKYPDLIAKCLRLAGNQVRVAF